MWLRASFWAERRGGREREREKERRGRRGGMRGWLVRERREDGKVTDDYSRVLPAGHEAEFHLMAPLMKQTEDYREKRIQ